MAAQPAGVLFLTGAPKSSDIKLDELRNGLLPSIQNFVGDQEVGAYGSCQEQLQSIPKWRSIPSVSHTNLPSFNSGQSFGSHLSSLSQNVLQGPFDLRAISFEPDTNNASPFPESALDLSTSLAHSQFLHHSLAFHEMLESSQIEPHDSELDFGTTISLSASSFRLDPSDDIRARTPQHEPTRIANDDAYIQLPDNLSTISLGSLPSADYLDSIYPQTLTPNFVVIVFSLSPPRSVITRANNLMMLYDVQVADETGSNFTISFWLPPRPGLEGRAVHLGQKAQLGKALDYLRSGDIILVRNVALSHFRGVVHGQSLNPTISRAHTAIHVLVRDGVEHLPIHQLGPRLKETVESVKSWAKQFVSANMPHSSKPEMKRTTKRKRSADKHMNGLPPDTQIQNHPLRILT